MAKELIKISLTEFMNYINRSGSQKTTVVISAKTRREEEYKIYTDYWLKLREQIKYVHKNNLPKEVLYSIVETVSEDKQDNYNAAINGYCSFWGKKKIEWVTPPRKTWIIGDIRIVLNPELGLKIKDRTYYIKLFTTSGNSIDKKHADLILTLMEQELREKADDTKTVFAVLDIKRGKLFEYLKKDTKIPLLLKAEARSFELLWNEL